MRSVTVKSIPDHTYAMQVDNGRGHSFVVDENKAAGGEDLGAMPYEHFLAGLGGCVAITLLMYARRKDWDLEDVSVTATHDKVHPAKCDSCSEEEKAAAGPSTRVDLINIEVRVKGDLDESQLVRLKEIAGRCPVHRTIESGPHFLSSIKLEG